MRFTALLHHVQVQAAGLPAPVTVDDAAKLLRTSRHAVYAMLERGQLLVPIRIGRRFLLRQDELLHWPDQKRARNDWRGQVSSTKGGGCGTCR